MSIKSRFQAQLREAAAGKKPAWKWVVKPYWDTPSANRMGFQVAQVAAQVEYTGASWPSKELRSEAKEAFVQAAQKIVAEKDPKGKSRYKLDMGGMVADYKDPTRHTIMMFYQPEY